MDHNQLPIERKVMILLGVLFLHLLLVSTNVVLKNQKTLLQNVVGTIVSPFQIGFQNLIDFISDQFKHYVFLKGSYEKYRDLKKKYTQLRYENYLLKRKIADQVFLSRVRIDRNDFIKADVISIDNNFPFTGVIIDKGTKDRITKDMIVLNSDLELVGKIVEPISFFSARVRLVTNSIGGIGAYIIPEGTKDADDYTGLEGLLTGTNSPICNFKYLIEKAQVEEGELVVTSGTDKIFLPGIHIGKVVKVEKEKEYLTQKIEVEPFFIKRPFKQLIVIANDNPAILSKAREQRTE